MSQLLTAKLDERGFVALIRSTKIQDAARKVAATTLNNSLYKAQAALRTNMAQVFDKPTPYTLNSLYVNRATEATLTGRVAFKDEAGKGNAAAAYLGPQVYGGLRSMKRFEKALQRIGVLPSGMQCVPGSAAALDGYGNMKASQVVQILSALQAFGEQGYKANAKSPTRKVKGVPVTIFALRRQRGRLPPGVYQRFSFAHGSALKPLLIFVKQGSYTQRFKFFDIAQEVVQREYAANYPAAFKAAIDGLT